MPNAFAEIALLSWPIITFVIFQLMSVPSAVAWTIVAGYLLLPNAAGWDYPLLPPIDKTLIPAASATVMALMKSRGLSAPPRSPMTYQYLTEYRYRWLFRLLLTLVLLTPFLTVLTNNDPVVAGRLYIPGLRSYDAFSIMITAAVNLVPFLLAQRFLTTEDHHIDLLKVLVISGAFYSLLALFEIRMSPQLNTWIYGFFPHSFAQHMRAGGFRPIVFLHHGLWLAIFLSTAILAAATLWKCQGDGVRRIIWLVIALGLLGVLVLAKSLGALLITIILLPMILFFEYRWQIKFAAVIAVLVMFFPFLRGIGAVPTEPFLTVIERLAPDRAQSFGFRLDNEDLLLERANLKPLAGWGSWGRSRIYHPETGQDLSVTDGAWIILIGDFGWLGYIGRFGLLCGAILLLAWGRRQGRLPLATTGLAIVLCANLIDLLPNATLTPLTFLIAGALAGGVQVGVPQQPLEPSTDRPITTLKRRRIATSRGSSRLVRSQRVLRKR
jgi:hypothetical protein